MGAQASLPAFLLNAGWKTYAPFLLNLYPQLPTEHELDNDFWMSENMLRIGFLLAGFCCAGALAQHDPGRNAVRELAKDNESAAMRELKNAKKSKSHSSMDQAEVPEVQMVAG